MSILGFAVFFALFAVVVFVIYKFIFRGDPEMLPCPVLLSGRGNAFSLHLWGGEAQIVQGIPVAEFYGHGVYFQDQSSATIEYCDFFWETFEGFRELHLRKYRQTAFSVVAVFTDRRTSLYLTKNVIGQQPELLGSWVLLDSESPHGFTEGEKVALYCVPIGCSIGSQLANANFRGEVAELTPN